MKKLKTDVEIRVCMCAMQARIMGVGAWGAYAPWGSPGHPKRKGGKRGGKEEEKEERGKKREKGRKKEKGEGKGEKGDKLRPKMAKLEMGQLRTLVT